MRPESPKYHEGCEMSCPLWGRLNVQERASCTDGPQRRPLATVAFIDEEVAAVQHGGGGSIDTCNANCEKAELSNQLPRGKAIIDVKNGIAISKTRFGKIVPVPPKFQQQD